VDIRVDSHDDGDGRHVLTVAGAVDIASRAAVLDAARAALARPGAKELVLDLEQVNFMDSSGIGALIEVGGDAQDAGIDFALRRPSARVRRVLQVTGLLDSWTIEPDADDSSS
jgi:anti-sigma B factor antagonist